MTIRRHFLLAAIETCVAIFVSMFLPLFLFRHALFEGKAPAIKLIEFSALSAVAALLVVFLQVIVDRTFEWRLDGTALVKKRTRPPNDELARVDLRQIRRFHARREVPFIGRVWTLGLTLNEIVEQPPVYFEFLGIKLTGSAGGHRLHSLYFLSRQDKDRLVSAIELASKTGAGAAGGAMLPPAEQAPRPQK